MFHSIFLFLQMVLGCSAYSPAPRIILHPTVGETRLVDYLKDFKKELETRGILVDYSYLNIRIGDELTQDVLGETFYITGFKRAWILFKSDYSRVTVYHELGHALFHLNHVEGDYQLMNMYAPQGTIGMGQMDDFAQQIRDNKE